jgi:hypothetical protein
MAAKSSDGVDGSMNDDMTSDIMSNDDNLMEATLFRLTQGLPKPELELIVSESEACEAELLREIEILEQAAAAADDDETSIDHPSSEDLQAILSSVLTPLDNYWTASALLGRLRDDLTMPRIPSSAAAFPSPVSNLKQPPTPSIDAASTMLAIIDMPAYTKRHDNSTHLMTLYKKLAMHRSALVFKKPVKDEEAPGYSDRIRFKMDLTLMRKLILAGNISSYKDFHEYAALISHNCVKFNGRDSDYGMLAREFERVVDDMIRHAVVSGPAMQQRKLSAAATASSEGIVSSDGATTSIEPLVEQHHTAEQSDTKVVAPSADSNTEAT